MAELIRTFIAVKIHPLHKLKDTLVELKNEFSDESIKWVEPENLHLTVKFLGNTNRNQVNEIAQLLEEAARNCSAIKLQLTGLGFFKNKGQPKVLFVNIERNDSLGKLFNSIENKLVKIGFEKEKRRFSPHLTLARIKHLDNRKRFYSTIEKFRISEFQETFVREIYVYQSVLTPSGSIYKPLKIIQLD